MARRLVPSRPNPNRKPAKRLRFGKEETDAEDKRPRAWRGDSFRRGQTQTANQQSVCGLERRKRAQRIRGLAHGAGPRSVEAVSDVPPAAPSFPSCRKRWGRKGALGRVWCVLRVQFRQEPVFIVVTNTPSHLTGALVRAACYDTPNLIVVAFERLR